MARYQHDLRLDAKRLADQMSGIAPASFQNELSGIACCTSLAAARSRVRALRTKARRAGLGDLVSALEELLKGPREDKGRPEICEICGADAVRFLRKPIWLGVCEEHSRAPARARDLRRIHAVLRDPPPEFFEALVRYESAIQLPLEAEGEYASNPDAPVNWLWRRLLTRSPIASSPDVWSLWNACCTPAPDSSYRPEPEWTPPITADLWQVVSNIAHARDAEASVRNGQQGGGRPRDQHQEKEIARLAARGLTQKAIAAKLGTTQCQVSRILRRQRAP
jgi:DNA-binding CsgD family transcriptional regulator